jgi:hypothetical protein
MANTDRSSTIAILPRLPSEEIEGLLPELVFLGFPHGAIKGVRRARITTEEVAQGASTVGG